MVEPSDLKKDLVEHIVNGRLNELCLICLIPLKENCSENIFSLICKTDTEYCIADALEAVCQFELHRTENYNVCIDCFKSASEAYKFHRQAKRSMELITYYIQELLNNLNNIEITSEDVEKLLLVPLPEYNPTTRIFDFNLDGVGKSFDENVLTAGSISKENDSISGSNNLVDISVDGNDLMDDSMPDGNDMSDGNIDIGKIADSNNFSGTGNIDNNSVVDCNDDFNGTETDNKSTDENVILVVNEKKEKSLDNGDSFSMHSSDDDEMVIIVNEKKVRKKRDPMAYMTCSQCPIKYRFVAKLKDHMKNMHNIDLYYCKVCKIITEHKQEYEKHLKTHIDKYQCTICNIVYKKADTLVTHMKLHKKGKDFQQLKHVNICEQCGDILEDEACLEKHIKNKHAKRYTCYYCGRMYRLEGSFEGHIRKHEEYWNKKQGSKPDETSNKKADKQADKLDKSKRSICQTCGKDFVDERSLLWHQRLHTNDRPYICDVCGRGFVSKNRRNQHCLCAHTPPQRRCPLCPALFHLRSMVNTHLKKVHLTAHKRRNRTTKHKNVFWRTQAVPIQELSIDVQNDVLELKAAQGEKLRELEEDNNTTSISLFVE